MQALAVPGTKETNCLEKQDARGKQTHRLRRLHSGNQHLILTKCGEQVRDPDTRIKEECMDLAQKKSDIFSGNN